MARLLVLMSIVAWVASEEITELKIETTFTPESCTEKSKKGDKLTMHYTGTLYSNGEQFDSSVGRGPFDFVIGSGQVIQGWEQGLLDMCVGEKRTLIIPPSLGYGERDMGSIPANSVLKFEVELLNIGEAGKEANVGPNIFKEIDANTDKVLSQDEVSSYVKKAMKDAGQPEPQEGEEHDKMISEIFEQEDKDKDGYISYDEFSGPKHEEL